MKNFSFIHAGDFHLDSPFKGVTAQSLTIAEALHSATFDAFDALVQLCVDKQVQFLLVAGDVYDGADRSLRAQLKFSEGLKKLADHNIRSFVVHGNHDPLDGWSSTIRWPVEVHIFGANQVETKMVEANGEVIASISGISYPKRNEHRNLAQKFKTVASDIFQIGILHCNCGGDPNHKAYAQCNLQDLTQTGFNYWALGHVHQNKILSKTPYVVYAGNTQGLSIREQGKRGCYLVSVSEDHRVDIDFCPLDAVRWLSAEINIDDINSIDGLDGAIAQTIDGLKEKAEERPLICRISLSGRGPLYRELRRDNAVKELLEKAQLAGLEEKPFVWLQDIEINCRPEVDLEKRREINDLLGQVLRVSKEIQDLVPDTGIEPQALEDTLMSALCELYGNRRAEKLLDPLSPQMLKKILQQAELLCVDFLETDD